MLCAFASVGVQSFCVEHGFALMEVFVVVHYVSFCVTLDVQIFMFICCFSINYLLLCTCAYVLHAHRVLIIVVHGKFQCRCNNVDVNLCI